MSDSDEDAYGPPLPPSMQNAETTDQYRPAQISSSKEECKQEQPNLIGPALPSRSSKPSRYSSDSESDSSSSSESDSDDSSRKRKKKKHKHSKSSDRNHAKRKSMDDEKQFIGPVVPSDMRFQSSKDSDDEGSRSIGPVLPPGLRGRTHDSESDSEEEVIGPALSLQASEEDQSAVREFVSRSQKMKEKLAASSKADETEAAPLKRESWMTELPEEMGVNIGLGNRQFRSREAPEMDSSWTEAPHEKGQKQKESKKRKKDKEEYFQSAQDKKAAKEIDAYNKKHRPESLLDMHKKELKKKKKKEKKKKSKDKAPERRPFDRDVDLKVNRFDNAMKEAYIKRSRELTSRFASGGTGTSFL